jgi:diguanylate cyclase
VTSAQHHLGGLRARTESRTIDASTSADPAMTVLLVVVTLLVSYGGTYVAGGSRTALPHAFYVPIVVAAVRFGSAGALVTAVVAGLAVGPLMPLNSTTGEVQELANWTTRLVIFVLVGQMTAYLCRHSLPSLSDERDRRRFHQEIERGLSEGQFHVAYQPIVDVRRGKIAGVEALIRWDHPSTGPVAPSEFVCRAEAVGCIRLITQFVLAETCRQIQGWRRDVLADAETFKVAVNVSAADLSDDDFARMVQELLDETGVPPRWLHLEITETALVRDVDAAATVLHRLRDLGVQLAIDDFGTGESSLAYLDRFEFDVLKVDRSFLRRIVKTDADDALTSGIVALARAMDLTVVAEGVETELQAAAVRHLGYDYAQGFLFSPPVRSGQMEAMLAEADPFAGVRSSPTRRGPRRR